MATPHYRKPDGGTKIGGVQRLCVRGLQFHPVVYSLVARFCYSKYTFNTVVECVQIGFKGEQPGTYMMCENVNDNIDPIVKDQTLLGDLFHQDLQLILIKKKKTRRVIKVEIQW